MLSTSARSFDGRVKTDLARFRKLERGAPACESFTRCPDIRAEGEKKKVLEVGNTAGMGDIGGCVVGTNPFHSLSRSHSW